MCNLRKSKLCVHSAVILMGRVQILAKFVFTFAQILLSKDMNASLLPLVLGQIGGQNGLSSYGWQLVWEKDNLNLK